MDVQNLITTDLDDNLLRLSGSDQLVHDWQAIRLVRDGYIASWRMTVGLFTWFILTLLGAGAFAIKADLGASFLRLSGVVGVLCILLVAGFLLSLRRSLFAARQSVDRIIEGGGVINRRYVTSFMLVGGRLAERAIQFMLATMAVAALFWAYVFFVYAPGISHVALGL